MMKTIKRLVNLGVSLTLSLGTCAAFADTYPQGDITFHNASQKVITAEITSIGKVNLPANKDYNVSYKSLNKICSTSPKSCTAQFYVNDMPAGSATINAVTGKLVAMKLQREVATTKEQNVLRRVVIK